MSWWVVGISAVVTLAGTGVTLYGQQQQKEAALDTSEYNAETAENEAKRVAMIANENARRKKVDNDRQLARLRAANAKNGLSLEGTPLAVLGETASTLERDILDIGYEASEKQRALFAGADMEMWQRNQTAKALTTSQWATAAKGIGSAAGGFLGSSGTV